MQSISDITFQDAVNAFVLVNDPPFLEGRSRDNDWGMSETEKHAKLLDFVYSRPGSNQQQIINTVIQRDGKALCRNVM